MNWILGLPYCFMGICIMSSGFVGFILGVPVFVAGLIMIFS